MGVHDTRPRRALSRWGVILVALCARHTEANAATCPSWSGFSAVGDTWDYSLSLFLFTGWERWELIALDADTGEVLVEVEGERISDGPIFTYTRTDRWRCDEDGLWSLGWAMDLTVSDVFGTFAETVDMTNEWRHPQLFLPTDPMQGDEWTIDDTSLDTTTSTGESWEDRENGYYLLSVGATQQDLVLGESLDLIPIRRYDLGYQPGVPDSYTSWYAEDIGLVRRDDLVLIDYTPAR